MFLQKEDDFTINYMTNKIPALSNGNLTIEELSRKRILLKDEIKQIEINHDVVSLLENFSRSSFQARNIGRAAKLYLSKSYKDMGIIWSLAGSLFSAGLREITIEAIRNNLVDVLVCTGALFEQDMLEALGHKHYACEPDQDDSELQKLKIDRIYDHLLDEMALQQVDRTFQRISASLPEGNYSSREFMKHTGKWLSNVAGVKDSVITTAYELNVPIFIPALNDSSIGIGIAMNCELNNRNVVIDSIKDLREMALLKYRCGDTGIIFVGGGVPKNYSQDSVVIAEMLGHKVRKHKFGIQISTADTRDGGLSGSTLKEAISWNKNDSAIEEMMIWGEATVYFTLLVSYVYKMRENNKRKGKNLANIFESK